LKEKSLKGNLRKAGSHIIHLGAVLLLIGIIFSTNMILEDSVVISVGEVGTFKSMGYSILITNITSGIEGGPYEGYSGSSYISTVNFYVYRWGHPLDSGQVKYISDFKWQQSYTETYIHRGLLEELFIAPKICRSKSSDSGALYPKCTFHDFPLGRVLFDSAGSFDYFSLRFPYRGKNAPESGLSVNRPFENDSQEKEGRVRELLTSLLYIC